MARLKYQKKKREIGSWVIGYWMPKDYFKKTMLGLAENRFKKSTRLKRAEQIGSKIINKETIFEALDNTDFLLVKKRDPSPGLSKISTRKFD
ncbi:MAG: hypothetical protein R2753_08065 [Chitinophagales bacterium]